MNETLMSSLTTIVNQIAPDLMPVAIKKVPLRFQQLKHMIGDVT
jgi:hypothetical protein